MIIPMESRAQPVDIARQQCRTASPETHGNQWKERSIALPIGRCKMKAKSNFLIWGFNRGVFLLACCGMFVALVLLIADIAGAKLPCGQESVVASGCSKVQMDTWSTVFGVPIALFGLGLYLAVALAAFLRDQLGFAKTQWLGVVLWVVLAVGTITSSMLLSHSHFQIDATCRWCVTNGIIMMLAFIMQTATIAQSAPGELRRWRLTFFAIPLVMTLLAGGGYGKMVLRAAEAETAGKQVSIAENSTLVRPGNPKIGDPNASVLVVAFSDLHCPPCRANHLALDKELTGRLNGRVHLVFRHFPLSRRHPNALDAAVFAEWAKSKGKFKEFVTAQFANQEKTRPDEMLTILTGIGLDRDEAKLLMTDKALRTRLLVQIEQDKSDATKLGVRSTPTWFVRYPDDTISMAKADGVFGLLSDDAINHHKASVKSGK